MKNEYKKFALLVWIEVFVLLLFANIETTKPLVRYVLIIFFLTAIYGYTRKYFRDYFKQENIFVKVILGMGILCFIIALFIAVL